MNFYDDIAGQYDQIVDQSDREASAREFAAWLVAAHRVTSGMEVACGTGLYARAMAELGVHVVASDISQPMLDQAIALSPVTIPPVRWLCASMQDAPRLAPGPYDALWCMGNSLPHLLTDDDLQASLAGFRDVLTPGGVLAVQLLNYDGVLAQRERVVGAVRLGDREYVRFYDFGPGLVMFNILELHWQAGKCSHRLHQTTLRPWRSGELQAALQAAGFAKVELLSGQDRSPFDLKASPTLLCIATR